jgi:succinoglycan biosynthesis protein ExoO
MPRVSVIIPAWRAAACVGRAIASARGQSLGDIEIIVVNDASPDDTAGAADRAACGDGRVRRIDLAVNGGPGAARNAALAVATGDWIAILDADDEIAPQRLERLVAAGEADGADIIADDLIVVNEMFPDAPARRLLNAGAARQIDLAAFARENRMFAGRAHSGYLKPLFRRAFLKRHGLRYDPAVRIGEDYLFAAAALAEGARYMILPEALYLYHVRGDSISRRLKAADVKALLDADDRFLARHGDKLEARARAAMAARRASLEDAFAFVSAVEALKTRQIGPAVRAVLRRPASVRHFGMPIGVRLARLAGRRGGT